MVSSGPAGTRTRNLNPRGKCRPAPRDIPNLMVAQLRLVPIAHLCPV